jgi:hypothetical protein
MVGSVSEVWRYPVKSMMGERLESLDVTELGVVGDRWWAVRDEEKGGIRGAKKIGALMDLSARFVEQPVPGKVPQVVITLPDGRTVTTADDGCHEVLTEALDRSVTIWPLLPADQRDHYRRGAPDHDDLLEEFRAIFGRTPDEPLPDLLAFPPELMEFESLPGTYYDAYPLLVMTTASLDRLGELAPDSIADVRRFRPNVLLDVDGDGFVEQDWIGKRLRLGEVELEIVGPCPRCVMVTRGFAELPQDRSILRTIVAEADQNIGVYASVVTTGTLAVGAEAQLLDG